MAKKEEKNLTGQIAQINISDGGVPKLAVHRATVTSLGLTGDRQQNTHVHGGPERAVCLYALERILALQAEGHPIFCGSAGENLTLWGLDWDLVVPGTILQIGQQVVLEITRYTEPCGNITESFLNHDSSRIAREKYPGWSRLYARVLAEGEIRVGDTISFK
jgi:MOSC domain-containing protein YiiM